MIQNKHGGTDFYSVKVLNMQYRFHKNSCLFSGIFVFFERSATVEA